MRTTPPRPSHIAIHNAGAATWLQANGFPFSAVAEEPHSTPQRRYYTWTYENTRELAELLEAWKHTRFQLFAASAAQAQEVRW